MAVTIKASKEGLKKVEEARKKKGWKADSLYWCDAAQSSQATLKRFRRGDRIQKETFIEICKAVGLNWEEIVDDTPPTEISDRMWFLTLNETIREVDKAKAEAIVAFVNQVLEREVAQLLRIEQGSVVLVLQSSLEAFERIEYLFSTGQLRSILGIEIEGVRLESAEIVNLRDWLESLYRQGWQPVELVMPRGRSRSGTTDEQLPEGSVRLAKEIELGATKVVLVAQITPESEEEVGVTIEIYPSAEANYLPPGLEVAIIDESDAIVLTATVGTNKDSLKIELGIEPEELLSVRLALGEVSITEYLQKFIVFYRQL